VPEVSTGGGHLTESALRPLAKLKEPEDQKKCWGEIKERSGKPEDVTPAVIKKTVREMFPPEQDEKEHTPDRDKVREWIHRYLGKYREDARVGILNMIEREAVSLKVDAEKGIEKSRAHQLMELVRIHGSVPAHLKASTSGGQSFLSKCTERTLRPPASPPETLRVTMWAGLHGTLRVSKRMELREALRAGLCVSF
jgi:hypothetical protein